MISKTCGVVVACGLLLGACSTVEKVTNSPHTGADVCVAAGGTLGTLAEFRTAGKLTTAQIATVDSVRPALQGFCAAGTVPPVGTAAYASFLANLGVLATIQLTAQGK